MPLDFGGHMFLELDYLAGPGGLGVQGVIGDCPAALMDWSRSLQWCVYRERELKALPRHENIFETAC